MHGPDETAEPKFSTTKVVPVGLSAPPVIPISSDSGKSFLIVADICFDMGDFFPFTCKWNEYAG